MYEAWSQAIDSNLQGLKSSIKIITCAIIITLAEVANSFTFTHALSQLASTVFTLLLFRMHPSSPIIRPHFTIVAHSKQVDSNLQTFRDRLVKYR